MVVRIYDSLRKEVVPLDTREDGRVAMYACGPTVYNYIHIGNARTLIWFDFIRRYLVFRGYQVTYVMNYTDVDDKIIERARLEDLPPEAITAKYTAAYEEDMAALGTNRADLVCRATDHVEDMVEAVQGLVDKGIAYEEKGDVFFSVEGFPGYGKLSGRTLDQMRAGERVEPHPGKRHPLDFALWKSAKEDEPSWPSPWGPGRPGWHIECSVMSTRYLGMGFDIHGGGSDLTFPHHENEIAQAEALAGTEPFAHHWMHAGMVQMEAEKMSKSLGNVMLAREVIERYGGEQARYWALMGSYRSQAAFNEASLADAVQAYERWMTFLASARHALGNEMPSPDEVVRAGDPADADPYVRRFIEEMDDDFNSAGAFAVVHDLVSEGNRRLEGAQQGDADDADALGALVRVFLELTRVLGFRFAAGDGSEGLVSDLLDVLLDLREEARSDRAFERSDAIRARLEELGVTIEDTPSGPRWRVGPKPEG